VLSAFLQAQIGIASGLAFVRLVATHRTATAVPQRT
jgi:hypothetical protein